MGQMVQQLLQNGLTTVPMGFVQPLERRVSQTPRKDNDGLQLPLVDLSRMEDDQGKKQVMSEISRARAEWAFVQVVNHGVPRELMDAAMDYPQRFFALPAEEKEVYNMRRQSGSNAGYGRVLRTTSVPLQIGMTGSSGRVRESSAQAQEKDAGVVIRSGKPAVRVFLQQGNVAGLEVLKGGGWLLVEPVPHAFVVNAGGILQIISDGRCKSVLHRVCSTHATTALPVSTGPRVIPFWSQQ